MLKRIALLFLALLLMLPCSLAEEAPEAAPAENPFVGAWEVLYYIQDGELLTGEAAAENPVMFVFTEDTLAYHFGDGLITESFYSADGNTCYINSEIYTLEHEDLIIGYATPSNMSLSFLLTRIDPIMLNNPFIGTWEVLCGADGDVVQVPPDTLTITFEAQQVQIFTDGVLDDVYVCTYGDGQCRIEWDGLIIIAAISQDGLLTLSSSEDPAEQIICAPEDEEVAEEISRFFGTWRDVAVLTADGMYTDQAPNALLFQYEFSRAYMQTHFPESLAIETVPELCVYADGACVVPYEDGNTTFTIDANGLMTAHFADGSTSWCIRVEEETPAAE